MKPTTQHWNLDASGRTTIARRGFPVASDLSGTAHSFMGATLDACTIDFGPWDTAPSRDAQLSGFMCLSRIKRSEDVCITQPFSPNLFTNGELIYRATHLLRIPSRQAVPETSRSEFRTGSTEEEAAPGHNALLPAVQSTETWLRPIVTLAGVRHRVGSGGLVPNSRPRHGPGVQALLRGAGRTPSGRLQGRSEAVRLVRSHQGNQSRLL